jgi:hypothetical protein
VETNRRNWKNSRRKVKCGHLSHSLLVALSFSLTRVFYAYLWMQRKHGCWLKVMPPWRLVEPKLKLKPSVNGILRGRRLVRPYRRQV